MKLIPNPYLSSHGVKRYIFFHNKRHPADMGEDEIRSFISDLASTKSVAASTQTVALSPLLFLYREVLKKDLLTSKESSARSGQSVCRQFSLRQKSSRYWRV